MSRGHEIQRDPPPGGRTHLCPAGAHRPQCRLQKSQATPKQRHGVLPCESKSRAGSRARRSRHGARHRRGLNKCLEPHSRQLASGTSPSSRAPRPISAWTRAGNSSKEPDGFRLASHPPRQMMSGATSRSRRPLTSAILNLVDWPTISARTSRPPRSRTPRYTPSSSRGRRCSPPRARTHGCSRHWRPPNALSRQDALSPLPAR